MVMFYGPPSCRCGNPFHNDCHALTKLHANQLMSLIRYLYHDDLKGAPKVEWVRATCKTTAQDISPDFLVAPGVTSLPEPRNANGQPEIINVFSTSFVPRLDEDHLQRIDSLISRSTTLMIPPSAAREAASGKEIRKPKEPLFVAGKGLVPKECSACHRLDPNLQTCARCKTGFYCNSVCQNKHWKSHKPFCKIPPKPEDLKKQITTKAEDKGTKEPKPEKRATETLKTASTEAKPVTDVKREESRPVDEKAKKSSYPNLEALD